MGRSYYINSNEVLIDPGWSISDKINARSTLNVTVIDKQLASITEGAEFQMFNDSNKIFEGVILRMRKYEGDPNFLYYDLNIVDNCALADRRFIAKTYENQTARYILLDMITEVLGEEGVTAGDIEEGPIITKAVFNYLKCSAALDYIKKVTGYNWNIDKNKKLQFFNRATNNAPWVLNDTIQHTKFQQESNMDDYRTIQYVRGGRGRTATQEYEVPTPAPDGKSRNFVMRFPLAEKPIIEINLNSIGWVEITPSDIGINGLDTNKKWYWTYGSQIITQDNSLSVLTNDDALRITYIGLRNLFVKIENPDGITNQGKYEALNTEKSINIIEQAKQYGNGLIQTYGEIKDTISFSTEVSGLEAGQLLPVEKSLYNINDNYLIESVNIRASDSGSIEYNIKALDGACIGGWEEFFKELLKGNRDYAINENEVLILLNLQQENQGYQGALNIYVETRIPNIPLLPSTVLYPKPTLYPSPSSKMVFDTEVDLND
jgi:hypothetical protein